MTLREFFEQTGVTRAEFAAKSGISQAFLSRVTNSKRTPTLPVALRIVDASGGKVDIRSLAGVQG